MKILKLLPLVLACLSFAWAEDEKPVKPAIKPEMVKAEVFKKRYARVGMAETVHSTHFVGVQEGVAILKVGDMNLLTKGWREKWIGVKLADLDVPFRTEVERAAAKIEADAALDPAQRAEKEQAEKLRLEKENAEALKELLKVREGGIKR